jgi:hypothetical protein
MVPYFVIYLTSYFVTCLNHMVQEGTLMWETLALQARTICLGNRSKLVTHTAYFNTRFGRYDLLKSGYGAELILDRLHIKMKYQL